MGGLESVYHPTGIHWALAHPNRYHYHGTSFFWISRRLRSCRAHTKTAGPLALIVGTAALPQRQLSTFAQRSPAAVWDPDQFCSLAWSACCCLARSQWPKTMCRRTSSSLSCSFPREKHEYLHFIHFMPFHKYIFPFIDYSIKKRQILKNISSTHALLSIDNNC